MKVDAASSSTTTRKEKAVRAARHHRLRMAGLQWQQRARALSAGCACDRAISPRSASSWRAADCGDGKRVLPRGWVGRIDQAAAQRRRTSTTAINGGSAALPPRPRPHLDRRHRQWRTAALRRARAGAGRRDQLRPLRQPAAGHHPDRDPQPLQCCRPLRTRAAHRGGATHLGCANEKGTPSFLDIPLRVSFRRKETVWQRPAHLIDKIPFAHEGEAEMIACGLDFGTSNSAIGVARDNAGRARAARSRQHADAERGVLRLRNQGPGAVRQRRHRGLCRPDRRPADACAEVDPGLLPIDEETSLGNRMVPLAEVVEIFVRHLKAQGRSLRRPGDHVRWCTAGRCASSTTTTRRMRRAQEMLEAIARRAGFRDVAFVYEPIAAAHHYERTVQTRRAGADRRHRRRHERLLASSASARSTASASIATATCSATAGVRVGGTDFDSALNLAAVMPLLGLGTQLVEKNSADAERALPRARRPGRRSTSPTAYRNERELAELVSHACEPEKVGRLLKRRAPTPRPSPGVRGGGCQDRAGAPRNVPHCASDLLEAGLAITGGTRSTSESRHRSQDRSAVQDGERLHRGGRPPLAAIDTIFSRVDRAACRPCAPRSGVPARPPVWLAARISLSVALGLTQMAGFGGLSVETCRRDPAPGCGSALAAGAGTRCSSPAKSSPTGSQRPPRCCARKASTTAVKERRFSGRRKPWPSSL